MVWHSIMSLDVKPKQKAWLTAAAVMLLLLFIAGLWWLVRDDTEPQPAVSSRLSRTATSRPAPRPRSPVGAVKYLNDLNGGNWTVTAGQAFMHVNTSGSYLYLSFTGGLSTKENVMLSARAAALKTKDDPRFGLTSDQIEKLQNIQFTNYMDRAENKTAMLQAWTEYQQTLADATVDDATKKAAGKKVIEALAKIGQQWLPPTRASFSDGAKAIETILTPEQIGDLTNPPKKKTWTFTPSK